MALAKNRFGMTGEVDLSNTDINDLFKKGNEELLGLFQAEVDKRWEELRNRCE